MGQLDDMKNRCILLLVIILSLLTACEETQPQSSDETQVISNPGPSEALEQSAWDSVKSSQKPEVMVSGFQTPYPQPIAGLAWEDSLHMTSDGLTLYCVYAPADLFSFIFNADADQNHAGDYLRGDSLGMDMTTNPVGLNHWIHGDMAYATRASLDEAFSPWQLANNATPVFSEASMDVKLKRDGSVDFVVYAGNDTPNNIDDIFVIWGGDKSLDQLGTPMPSPINGDDVREDNPNMTRISENHLILYYTIHDKEGGYGREDIWFSESTDMGITWSDPQIVEGINTSSMEDMPFFYIDTQGTSWLYFASETPSTQTLEIYRASMSTGYTDFNRPERVIGAGSTLAVGEPTLDMYGNLSFVVAYDKGDSGNRYDRFDVDPWYLPVMK